MKILGRFNVWLKSRRTKMSKEEIKLILTHELVHAFLGMGGRAYEENISTESVCEFIAWNIDEIIKSRDKILKEVLL